MLRCARGMAALSQIRWMAQIHLSAKCHQLVIPLPEMSPEPSGALVKKALVPSQSMPRTAAHFSSSLKFLKNKEMTIA